MCAALPCAQPLFAALEKPVRWDCRDHTAPSSRMPTCRRGTTRATTSITLKRLRCQAGACHRSRPEKCTEHPLPSDGVARLLHGLPGPSTPCRDGIRGGTCLRSTRPLSNLRGAGWLRLSPLVDVQRVSRTECPQSPACRPRSKPGCGPLAAGRTADGLCQTDERDAWYRFSNWYRTNPGTPG